MLKKAQLFKIFFLVYTTLHSQCTDPDPVEIFLIRPKRSGSGSTTLGKIHPHRYSTYRTYLTHLNIPMYRHSYGFRMILVRIQIQHFKRKVNKTTATLPLPTCSYSTLVLSTAGELFLFVRQIVWQAASSERYGT